MYGKLNDEGVEYAPINYETEDGNLILNFNKNEQLMTQYGYKMVIEQIPEYDINVEKIYEKEYIENEDNIIIIYEIVKIEPTNDQITIDKLIELERTIESLNSQIKVVDLGIKTNKKDVNELNLEVKGLQMQQNNYDIILSEEVNK